MKKSLIASLVIATLASQTACIPVLIAGGAGAAGYTTAQDRPVAETFSDTGIKAKVNAKFFSDQNSADYKRISINVVEGRVLLAGYVPSREAKLAAYNLAWQVSGVKQVINEVKVDKDATKFSAKQMASDSWVSTQISSRLLFAKDVKSVNYSVETISGVVYLMGIAQDRAELDKVTNIVSQVSGVTKVVSYVRIKGSSKISESHESGNPVSVEEQPIGTVPAQPKQKPLKTPTAKAPLPVKAALSSSNRQTLNKLIEAAINATIKYLKLDAELKKNEISVVITDNHVIQSLNRTYRKKDYATNVLSFPYIRYKKGELMEKNSFTHTLGEMVLSYEKFAEEAAEQGKELNDHIVHLVIHSTLHLLGYDHEKKKQAAEMEKIEIEILKKNFKIKNPYIS